MFKNKQKLMLVVIALYWAFMGGLSIAAVRTAEEPTQSLQVSAELSEAVSFAIKNRGENYFPGEFCSEGHRILEAHEENGVTVVYASASIGWFGFENGVFTIVSGSGAIPTVLSFSKNEQGEYFLRDYKEANVEAAVKKLFPPRLWPVGNLYPELAKQQETQAEAYLKSIGRTARVSAAHVEVELADINVQAANKLLEIAGQDSLLSQCPYWLGTREQVENGLRYIYEKAQGKTCDGYDLITFRKMNEDGSLIEAKKYKIVGNEPRLID